MHQHYLFNYLLVTYYGVIKAEKIQLYRKVYSLKWILTITYSDKNLPKRPDFLKNFKIEI